MGIGTVQRERQMLSFPLCCLLETNRLKRKFGHLEARELSFEGKM